MKNTVDPMEEFEHCADEDCTGDDETCGCICVLCTGMVDEDEDMFQDDEM